MGLCCRQNKNLSFDANSLKNPSLFVGDSIMKKQNFFINIASKKGTSILKNINKKYLKNFSKFYKSNLKLSKFENITIKVVKQSSSNLNEIKVNFLKYKNDKKVKLRVKDLFFTIVDSKEFEDYKLLKLLNEALNSDEALESLLSWSYDLYCYDNYEFTKLGMDYGLDLVVYEANLEYPPPWDINNEKRIFTAVERVDIYREILRIRRLFVSGKLCVNYEWKY